MKIAHIADVHFRSLSRHEEYKEMFEVFAKEIQSKDIHHVFVGGDIFHTKTAGISPEFIDLLTWWINRLTIDITLSDGSHPHLHLTLGNHDGNLVNQTRQDAVSPIVTAINNPLVHLYKASGVYPFADGYNLCVFSLFDEAGWESVKPRPGDINIACYHGPVDGAHTETGWKLESNVSIDMFKDYDYCFLGDIHKMQFLDYREIELEIDEEDLHKYPGAEIVS